MKEAASHPQSTGDPTQVAWPTLGVMTRWANHAAAVIRGQANPRTRGLRRDRWNKPITGENQRCTRDKQGGWCMVEGQIDERQSVDDAVGEYAVGRRRQERPPAHEPKAVGRRHSGHTPQTRGGHDIGESLSPPDERRVRCGVGSRPFADRGHGSSRGLRAVCCPPSPPVFHLAFERPPSAARCMRCDAEDVCATGREVPRGREARVGSRCRHTWPCPRTSCRALSPRSARDGRAPCRSDGLPRLWGPCSNQTQQLVSARASTNALATRRCPTHPRAELGGLPP